MKEDKRVVLYVDDDKPNLSVFKISFKRDFKVVTASSGDEALEKLKENNIDIILTDQRMPGMTGIELLDKIKDQYPGMIRVLVSEFVIKDEIKEESKRVGVAKTMTKPWDTNTLRDTLMHLLTEKA